MKYGYPTPNNFFGMNKEQINNVLKDVNEDVKKLNGKIADKKY